jgi:alpha-glucoside transport system permease protein
LTSTSASVAGQAPLGGPPPPRGLWSRWKGALAFVAPAFVLLIVFYIYPTIRTIIRSFYSNSGNEFVGIDNYKQIFTDEILLTAVKNNAIWVAVVPAAVTAFGLMFAVMTERISWAVAFKFAVFAPLAISLFAAGIIWRSTMYPKDPNLGTINHVIEVIKDAVSGGAVLTNANPSTDNLTGTDQSGFTLQTQLQPGDTAKMGLTAIPPAEMPASAKQAVDPQTVSGGISGVIWRDFSPGGGTPGEIEPDELGIPGATVDLLDTSGKKVDSTTTEDDGSFEFTDLEAGSFQTRISKQTFAEPFTGVSWLGAKLITPAMIIAYIWTAAGFSMVIIGAGLAAIPRDVLEAARTDGASEWQVFRRVTVPLLAPVLSVVFITQVIGVLKVFDIVLAISPGSTLNDATVLALEMWRKSFSGQNQFGVGAALAVFLFLLVIPVLLLNIRRFRRENIGG